MKRVITLIILFLCVSLLGCSAEKTSTEQQEDRAVIGVDITEKLYVSFDIISLMAMSERGSETVRQ